MVELDGWGEMGYWGDMGGWDEMGGLVKISGWDEIGGRDEMGGWDEMGCWGEMDDSGEISGLSEMNLQPKKSGNSRILLFLSSHYHQSYLVFRRRMKKQYHNGFFKESLIKESTSGMVDL